MKSSYGTGPVDAGNVPTPPGRGVSGVESGVLASARRTAWSDMRVALRWAWIEKLAGSPLTPQALRFVLLRVAGIQMEWPVAILWMCTFEGSNCRIGRQTFINRGLWVQGRGKVVIGRGCLFGPEVMVVTAQHPLDADGRISRHSLPADVHIGDRCWIGARVTVMPGVNIGDDVTVAASAVVSKDCEPGCLYGGVPARALD